MTLDTASLAGVLRVQPGGELPTIASTRRELAPLLGRGQPATQLGARLSLLFTLCGGAHRVAADRAVAAAGVPAPPSEHTQHDPLPGDPAQRQALRVDTLREHLRRLWLDAPRALPDQAPPDPADLAGCALLRRADALDKGRAWARAHVFGMPVAEWLAAWNDDPRCAAEWAARGATWPARWLHGLRARLGGLQQRVVALAAHASPQELQRLAAQLRQEEGFALAPTWRGRSAETGCWTRLADRHAQDPDGPYAALWLRHAARLADLARLLEPGGERWLALGGLSLAEGEGLGWCEMARGLLVHWVRVDGEGCVADCRLIAPTEWNFHPYGSAARALAQLSTEADAAQVRRVVGAYDPCVAVEVS